MTLDPEKLPIIAAGIGETVKTIAGAGTGKTSVLVERYLRFVLEEGIPPARLLALTFTKKAASEMRTRVFREAAEREAAAPRRPGVLRELHNAWIMNFHQFALRVMKESAALFGLDPGAEVATELDLRRIERRIRRRLETGEIEGWADDLGDEIMSVTKLGSLLERWLAVVARARGTLWTPESLNRTLKADDPPAYRSMVHSIAALWTAWEDELRRANLIDFSDMLRAAVRGLRESAAIAERYAGRFDHILVDEFQDTNEIQNELLRALSGGDFSRVTVVGDDKQSIYRWRDARVENLRAFAGREHFLRVNHRSTQNILDLAHYFVISDPYFESRAEDIRLRAFRGASDVPICLYHPSEEKGPSPESEADALAAWILAITGRLGERSPFACYREPREPLAYGDIAVLMRKLKGSPTLRECERAFREAGIPYAVSGGGGSIETGAFERLIELLRVIIYPDDVQSLLGLLERRPFLVPDASLAVLFRAAGGAGVDAILSDAALSALEDEGARGSCERLRALLDELRESRLTLELPAFISRALEAGPFYCSLFDEGADEKLVETAVRKIVELVDGLVLRGEGNLAALIEALEVEIASKAGSDGGSGLPAGRVRVMTIHSAKGLQFPAVAVPGIARKKASSRSFCFSPSGALYLNDAKEWGRGAADCDAYERECADHEQEEKCLLYVAFTRARDHLFISSPSPDGEGRGGSECLFGIVLDALKNHGVPHEELRHVPAIGTFPEALAREREGREDRGSGEARSVADPGASEALIEQWRQERARLRSAVAELQPAREIEFVSWRRLYAFTRCPAMYYYRYVAGIGDLEARDDFDTRGMEPGVEDPEEPGEERRPSREADRKTLGLFTHRLLFEWMSGKADGGASPDRFAENAARRFGASASERPEFVRHARSVLRAVADAGLSDRSAVEGLEVPIAARRDRMIFRGTIDRIDRAPDGQRIIDYKGKERRDEYAYQVRFYAWILGMTGRPVSKEADLCYLTDPARVVSVDVAPPSLEGIEEGARRLEEAAASASFPPAPGEICGACAFRGICSGTGRLDAASSR